MDFEFSDDQEMLRASVRGYLSHQTPLSWLRSVYGAPTAGAGAAWTGLAAMGVTGLLVPEAYGGAGMGMTDACVVLEELGRLVSPLPYISSAIGAVSAIDLAGADADRSSYLPALADGSCIGTVALYEADARLADSPTVALTNGTVTGEKVHIADAAVADFFVVSVRDGADVALVVIDARATGVEIIDDPSVDGSRPEARVVFADAAAHRLGTADASAALEHVLDRIAVALTVDGVGAASVALDLAVEYAKDRKQFGAPIGSFQAVQHLCADMLREVELARVAGYYACWADDEADDTERHRAATMAKAYASDELYRVGASAVQVFAGVGYTWEHDIHFFYKRLLTLQHAMGSSSDHLAALATQVI